MRAEAASGRGRRADLRRSAGKSTSTSTPIKLSGFGLNLVDIEQTIANENVTLPAGNIKSGLIDYTVRVPGEYEDPEEAKDIVVKRNASGGAVYLRDVATVLGRLRGPDRLSGANGEQA